MEEAARVHGLDYPIALDSNYATWNAYSNNSWPAKYLIDQHGDIRFRHFGEGAYAETEEKIRELLAETGFSVEHIPANSDPDPVMDDRAFSADPARRLTRELYAGCERKPTLPSSAFAGRVGSTPAYIMHEEYYQQKDAVIFYQDLGEHFNHFIFLQGLWHNGPQQNSDYRGRDPGQPHSPGSARQRQKSLDTTVGDGCWSSHGNPPQLSIPDPGG